MARGSCSSELPESGFCASAEQEVSAPQTSVSKHWVLQLGLLPEPAPWGLAFGPQLPNHIGPLSSGAL
jgi:hypothetical protein